MTLLRMLNGLLLAFALPLFLWHGNVSKSVPGWIWDEGQAESGIDWGLIQEPTLEGRQLILCHNLQCQRWQSNDRDVRMMMEWCRSNVRDVRAMTEMLEQSWRCWSKVGDVRAKLEMMEKELEKWNDWRRGQSMTGEVNFKESEWGRRPGFYSIY